MYRCILAPVDGGSFGEHALAMAATIAARGGAILRLVHVHVPPLAPAGLESVAAAGPWNDILKEQASGYLADLAERLASVFAVRVEHQVMEGPIPEALKTCAQVCSADLVVMSTHGHAGFRRVWHHCVAEQVLEHLSIPVVLVRPRHEAAEPDLTQTHSLKHLLIPLEGTEHTQPLLDHAIRLGRAFGSRFTLLKVVKPKGGLVSSRAVESHHAHGLLEREEVVARKHLDAVAARLRSAGFQAGSVVRVGPDAGEEIVAFARESGEQPQGGAVDLIAMERHLHQGLGQVLATHTTDQVIRDAGVPVLLFPGEAASISPSDRSVERPTAQNPG